MENKAHYALIGALVIAFLVSALMAVLWLSGSTLDQEFDEYVVKFDGPIRGVEEAAQVRFNGIKVGEVTSIRLAPEDPNKVLVRINVFQETPVDTQSYAQLEPQGLTGLNIIQLSSGGGNYPLLKNVLDKGPYEIEGRKSQFDDLLRDSGSIVESAQMALNGLTAAVDEGSAENFKIILENIAAITTEYRDSPITAERIDVTLRAIEQASADVSVASVSVDETARETALLFEEQVKPLIGKVELTIAQVDTALIETQTLLRSSNQVALSANGAVTDFSAGPLRDLQTASVSLNELIITLNRVAEELERNPSSFIVGEKREIMELPR